MFFLGLAYYKNGYFLKTISCFYLNKNILHAFHETLINNLNSTKTNK